VKDAVFWDVTPCGSCKSRRFGDVPPKRRLLQIPHGVTSQKTQFFTFTLITYLFLCLYVYQLKLILHPTLSLWGGRRGGKEGGAGRRGRAMYSEWSG
jgi:hypothetical protein